MRRLVWRVMGSMPLLICLAIAVSPGRCDDAVAPPNHPQEKPRLVLQTGFSPVTAVAISKSGRFALTASGDKIARLWDLASGQELRKFIGHSDAINSVAFSPDGSRILTGSGSQYTLNSARDNTARLWDIASGQELHRFQGHDLDVTSVAFSPDGKKVLTGSKDATMRLWDADNGRELQTFKDNLIAIDSVAFSPNGQLVASGGLDNKLTMWDLSSGKKIREMDHPQSISSVCFSPDGKQILTGCWDDKARLWDCASGKELQTFVGHTGPVTSVAFSPHGRQVLTGGYDMTSRLWNVDTGQEIRKFQWHLLGNVSVSFAPDGKHVLTGTVDGQARLWDTQSGEEIRTLKGHTYPIYSAVFSPDGTQILSGSDFARLWDLSSGRMIQKFVGHNGLVSSGFVSPDGKQVLTGASDGSARLWDVTSGKEIQRLIVDDKSLQDVRAAYFPDGKQILTIASAELRIWSASDGKELRRFSTHQKVVESVSISPDGKRALTGSRDGSIRIWDVATGQLLAEQEGLSAISSTAFSPDGKQMLIGSSDRTARLKDTENGNLIQTFVGHTNAISSVAFSPDGNQVLTGSRDQTVRIWDGATGKTVRVLECHDDAANSVAYSPDGKTIITGNAGGSVTLWDPATGEKLCNLVGFDNGDWAVADPQGRFDSANAGDVEGMHWVVDNEPIELGQLKDRYYEPHLLAKKMGFNKEPLRDVQAFTSPKLFPEVKIDPPAEGETKFAIRLSERGGGIGTVVVLINGKQYDLPTSARRGSPTEKQGEMIVPIDLTNDPRLVPGQKNQIEVQAFNSEGYLRSRGLEFAIIDPRAVTVTPPHLWGLIAGVSHYHGGSIDLAYPAKDAKDFATGIAVAAGRLFGAEQVHLTVLTSSKLDGTAQPDPALLPTRANLLQALQSLGDANRVQASDIVVVYLAGHGVSRGGADDGFFYLTSDAQDAQLDDPELRRQWSISDREMTDLLERSPAQKQVMILDTCHSGKVVEDLTKPREVSSSQERALQRVKDSTGFYILAGCAADKASYEASRYGQGVLTYSLLLGMRGAALKESQFVDVGKLFDFAKLEVPQLAGNLGGVQQPVVASPKGASFEIGQVTAEDQAKIPLQTVRPMVLRTNFHDADDLDPLGLSEQMDDTLRNLAAASRGSAPLAFADARRLPGAYRLVGSYQVRERQVTVTVRLVPAEGQADQFSVEGDASQVPQLAAKICEQVQERLTSK